MGRRAATALHLALFLLGALLYVVFILPRWWVLTGGIPPTLATVGRIAAGLPIGAAAVPVWLILQRSLRPSAATPELALRLRAWSAVLHVIAGALILLAAITEIWLSLMVGGPWLFGVYGAAAAIAVLAVTAFSLSFVAEKPPGPAKPPKAKKAKKAKKEKKKKRAKESGAGADDAAEPGESPDTGPATEPDAATATEEVDSEAVDSETDIQADTDTAEPDTAETAAAEPAAGGLRNQRISDRGRRLRR